MKTHRESRRSATLRFGVVGLPSYAAALLVLVFLAPAGLRAEPFDRAFHVTPQLEALARRALVTLPTPPPWDTTGDFGAWTIDDIKAEFAKVTDTPPQINFMRTKFLRPDHAWMLRFKSWFRSLEKPLRIRYEDQLWDCDNYANCFVTFADLLALKSGETRGTFCIGWATVYYRRPFAGVRGGAHAIVIVGTSKGLFVIEPQDGTIAALKDFPNRNTIESVYF